VNTPERSLANINSAPAAKPIWSGIEVVITALTRNQHGLLPAKEPQTRMNQGLSGIRIS